MIETTLAAVHWPAVAVAALANMILGALWFGPLFMKPWMDAMGIRRQDIDDVGLPKAPAYGAAAAAAVVLALVLAVFVVLIDARTPLAGAALGAMAWTGFNATSFFRLVFFEDRPWKLFVILAGYDLLSCAGMGALLAAWR